MITEMDKSLSPELSNKLNIIKELGYNLTHDSVIMDFGCGSGKMVKELRDLGYQAFGCGTRFNSVEGVNTETMMKEGIIRTIDTDYHLKTIQLILYSVTRFLNMFRIILSQFLK
jgi:2-polyprenyl-3-methyl-5-hydroxy-6-metoxy-1,4-benzoquinol methylase